ncbi:MAG: restriction modification system specificity domain protein [Streptosporangiaceae bacterium]|jgi:type I restriction enzyme S subunit|nr:restriction modification system specificity domain protein [Streptosporangiaceae bacterium]
MNSPIWADISLGECVVSVGAGVSVNSEDRPHVAGEVGVLKTSAVSGGLFKPHEHKAVISKDRPRVAEPVLGGSVLFSRMNTPLLVGESCYVESDHPSLFLPDRLWQIRVEPSLVDARWLSYNLQSAAVSSAVRALATGTSASMKNIAKRGLLALKIPLPALAEQRRVSRVLNALDAQISALQSITEKLSVVRLGLLEDLMTRGVESSGRLRPSPKQDAALYVNGVYGLRPKAWRVGLLDKFAKRGSGHTPNKNVPSYWNGGIKWVSLADSSKLDRFLIENTDKQISQAGIANSSAVLHPAGTVILSRDAGVGKSAILAESMAVSQHFMAWQVGRELNKVYLYYWLQYMKRSFEGIALGSTIQTIGLPYFRRLHITVPPLEEQEEIAHRLRLVDVDLDRTRDELAALKLLKQGLASDLLSGRVRVPDGGGA